MHRGDSLSRGESLALSCILQPLHVLCAEFALAHRHAQRLVLRAAHAIPLPCYPASHEASKGPAADRLEPAIWTKRNKPVLGNKRLSAPVLSLLARKREDSPVLRCNDPGTRWRAGVSLARCAAPAERVREPRMRDGEGSRARTLVPIAFLPLAVQNFRIRGMRNRGSAKHGAILPPPQNRILHHVSRARTGPETRTYERVGCKSSDGQPPCTAGAPNFFLLLKTQVPIRRAIHNSVVPFRSLQASTASSAKALP